MLLGAACQVCPPEGMLLLMSSCGLSCFLCKADPAQTREHLPPETQCLSRAIQVLPSSSPTSCPLSRPPSPGQPFPTTSKCPIPLPERLMDRQENQMRALQPGTRLQYFCLASERLHAGLGGGVYTAEVHLAGWWPACCPAVACSCATGQAHLFLNSAWRLSPVSALGHAGFAHALHAVRTCATEPRHDTRLMWLCVLAAATSAAGRAWSAACTSAPPPPPPATCARPLARRRTSARLPCATAPATSASTSPPCSRHPRNPDSQGISCRRLGSQGRPIQTLVVGKGHRCYSRSSVKGTSWLRVIH